MKGRRRDLNPASGLHRRSRRFDFEDFKAWLEDFDLAPLTVERYLYTVKRLLKVAPDLSPESIKAWVRSYENPHSYNNALKAARYVARYLGFTLDLKQRGFDVERLITPPRPAEVRDLLTRLTTDGQRVIVLALASSGLRLEALIRLSWNEIDFRSGFIKPRARFKRTKLHRPQPMHPLLEKMLRMLKDRGVYKPFPFEHRSSISCFLSRTGSWIRASNLRDFFYNTARKAGMDPYIVEWLMGHSLGVRQHYLADTVKEEYQKFIEATKWVFEPLETRLLASPVHPSELGSGEDKGG